MGLERPCTSLVAVARWAEIEEEAPDLAGMARKLFDAGVHKTIATLRRDGSPRISGIECLFVDGDLWFGGMWQGVKALDMLRDPRFALHSASSDPAKFEGDAKVAGTAEEITDPKKQKEILTQAPPGPAHLFRADINELVIVTVSADMKKLVIESWHPGRGVTRHER
jgi:hypothetical protein